jgi:hypothetical protein
MPTTPLQANPLTPLLHPLSPQAGRGDRKPSRATPDRCVTRRFTQVVVQDARMRQASVSEHVPGALARAGPPRRSTWEVVLGGQTLSSSSATFAKP